MFRHKCCFQIILFGFPGHVTHLLQPLDVGILGPLKFKHRSLAQTASIGKYSPTVRKETFATTWSQVMNLFCTKTLVQQGFARSGVYPVNRDAIDKTKLRPTNKGYMRWTKETNNCYDTTAHMLLFQSTCSWNTCSINSFGKVCVLINIEKHTQFFIAFRTSCFVIYMQYHCRCDTTETNIQTCDLLDIVREKTPCVTCGQYPHSVTAVQRLTPEEQLAFPDFGVSEAPRKKRKCVVSASVINAGELMQQLQEKENDSASATKVVWCLLQSIVSRMHE